MKYFGQARCESQKCLWNMRGVCMERGVIGVLGWFARETAAGHQYVDFCLS